MHTNGIIAPFRYGINCMQKLRNCVPKRGHFGFNLKLTYFEMKLNVGEFQRSNARNLKRA